MDKIHDIFQKYLKLGPFCAAFTNINPAKGLYHRLKGYNTGGKPADLTDDDRKELKEGLIKFVKEVNELIDKC